jgi:hypothetical protein
MTAPAPSRVQLGRLRASAAKRALAATSAIAFLAAAGLARASHPGHATSPVGASGAATTSDDVYEDDGFSLGSADSFGSAGAATPQIQSSVS